MQYGVNSRAQFFRGYTKELAFSTGGKNIDILPKTNISETSKNPIIFEWGSHPDHSYNFRDTRLIFQVKIANSADGSAPTLNNKLIRPVNGFGVLFFKRMELFLNDTPVHTSLMDIGIKTLIDTMLEKPKNTENSDILWGYTYNPLEANNLDNSSAYFGRERFQQLRDWTTFIIKIPLDFCRTTINIPALENLNWELRLYPHDNEYILNYGFAAADHSTELNTNWIVKLQEMKLRLRCDKFTHETSQGHIAQTLTTNIPYRVYYKPTVVRTYMIPAALKFMQFTDIFPRQKPVAIWVTFVKQDAFLGSKEHDPCYFHPGEGFESLSVYSNSELVGETRPLKIKMDDNETLKELYNHNRNVIGLDVGDQDLFWSHKDLNKGYFLWGVPIRPTSEAEGLVPMMDETVINASVTYNAGAAKTDTMMIIFYAIMTLNELKIYYDGSISNDFTM